MQLKDHARYALAKARALTESLLPAFKTREDWLYRPTPHGNHALWIVAHLGLADNMFASKFRPESAAKPAGWDELFWFGSELREDGGAYPPEQEVVAYFHSRRENLLSVLDEVTEEELASPAPEQGVLAGAPNMGHLFLFGAYHEGIHCGQLTAVHRGLGNPPLRRPQE